MKILIIYCHPNPKSFNHAIKERAKKKLKDLGHEVRVRDLYALGFDPALSGKDFEAIHGGNIPESIRTEQEQIVWSDVMVFVHPVWWTGLPAVLKGYIDRVFSFGFAYIYKDGQPQGLLNGKKVFIVNTTGSPSEHYEETGMRDALKITSDIGIYQFCGFEVIDHVFFGAVPSVTDGVRKTYLTDLDRVIEHYFC